MAPHYCSPTWCLNRTSHFPKHTHGGRDPQCDVRVQQTCVGTSERHLSGTLNRPARNDDFLVEAGSEASRTSTVRSARHAYGAFQIKAMAPA